MLPMRLKSWFWLVLLAWCVTGLPIAVIGVGFAGDTLASAGGLLNALRPPLSSVSLFVEWLTTLIFVLMPVLALPWAIGRRQKDSASG
jgi:uncharacterized membrane protein YhaH (DUF805 family)